MLEQLEIAKKKILIEPIVKLLPKEVSLVIFSNNLPSGTNYVPALTAKYQITNSDTTTALQVSLYSEQKDRSSFPWAKSNFRQFGWHYKKKQDTVGGVQSGYICHQRYISFRANKNGIILIMNDLLQIKMRKQQPGGHL